MCNSSVLALFASGRTRGLVLEVGGGVAHAVPVFEGFALNHAVLRLEGAGQDITNRLKGLLEERGHHLPVSSLEMLLLIWGPVATCYPKVRTKEGGGGVLSCFACLSG